MYQVGFGDCLLLSFEYAEDLPDGRRQRHILFECGSTHRPWDGWQMKHVTDKIQQHTGGQVDGSSVSFATGQFTYSGTITGSPPNRINGSVSGVIAFGGSNYNFSGTWTMTN